MDKKVILDSLVNMFNKNPRQEEKITLDPVDFGDYSDCASGCSGCNYTHCPNWIAYNYDDYLVSVQEGLDNQ